MRNEFVGAGAAIECYLGAGGVEDLYDIGSVADRELAGRELQAPPCATDTEIPAPGPPARRFLPPKLPHRAPKPFTHRLTIILVMPWTPAERFASGEHRIARDGRDAAGSPVAAGSYFVRIHTNERVMSRRVVVVP